MIRKFEYTDILGWSHSRYSTFRTCKRQYFYSYYGKYDAKNLAKINFLKSLTSVPLEIGNITHKILKIMLERLQKSSNEINRQQFFDYSGRKAKEIFDKKVFAEIYYKERKEIDFDHEIIKPVFNALGNFLDSERLEWILEEALTENENWIIEPEGMGECRIDGMKAYCKVDFLFPLDGNIFVIDWKTGKVDTQKHMDQLKGYVAWVTFHFEKAYDEITPILAYLLPEYSERRLTINEYDILEFTSMIRSQTEEMYAYCEKPEKNFPLPIEDFALNENTKICAYCNYRELCGREEIKPQKD